MTDFKNPERFWSKVEVGEIDQCWEWLAQTTGRGYGRFQIHGRGWQAHRVAWVLTFGPIPRGLLVCHHCDNRGCCNPYHLFLGTQVDNMTDAARKGRLGRDMRGERNPNSQLTEDDVLDMRDLYASGWTQQELADEFGVSQPHVSKVVSQKSWKPSPQVGVSR